MNDRPFTDRFRQGARALTRAPVFFGVVPPDHWSYPPHINQTRAAELRATARGHMPYGGSESYRFMCRREVEGWSVGGVGGWVGARLLQASARCPALRCPTPSPLTPPPPRALSLPPAQIL